MGDTTLPEAAPGYGSTTTMSVGAAVMRAAQDVRRQLGFAAEDSLRAGPSSKGLIEAMHRLGTDEITGLGSFAPPEDSSHAVGVFGAIFIEVGVDPELGLLRLRRAVARYSVGRIMNTRTARSQMTGGIIWGWGKVAMEQSHHEARFGRWLSQDLASVALPTHADIPGTLDVDFIDEVDDHASPIGGKGIGELGATGVDAAVADAIFHATGRRIRTLPITPNMLVA